MVFVPYHIDGVVMRLNRHRHFESIYGIKLSFHAVLGDGMHALNAACVAINDGIPFINLKDYQHIKRLWEEAHSKLNNREALEPVVVKHRIALRDAPNRETFALLSGMMLLEWTDRGEAAFADAVINYMHGGQHDGWFRGAAEIAGDSPTFVPSPLLSSTCVSILLI